MAIETEDGVPRVRVRLTAGFAADGEIDEEIEYVLAVDEDDEPTSRADMSRYDRGHIEVHYCRPAVTRPTTSRTRPRRSSAGPCVRPTGVPSASRSPTSCPT